MSLLSLTFRACMPFKKAHAVFAFVLRCIEGRIRSVDKLFFFYGVSGYVKRLS